MEKFHGGENRIDFSDQFSSGFFPEKKKDQKVFHISETKSITLKKKDSHVINFDIQKEKEKFHGVAQKTTEEFRRNFLPRLKTFLNLQKYNIDVQKEWILQSFGEETKYKNHPQHPFAVFGRPADFIIYIEHPESNQLFGIAFVYQGPRFAYLDIAVGIGFGPFLVKMILTTVSQWTKSDHIHLCAIAQAFPAWKRLGASSQCSCTPRTLTFFQQLFICNDSLKIDDDFESSYRINGVHMAFCFEKDESFTTQKQHDCLEEKQQSIKKRKKSSIKKKSSMKKKRSK
jgi:hypothetical protein